MKKIFISALMLISLLFSAFFVTSVSASCEFDVDAEDPNVMRSLTSCISETSVVQNDDPDIKGVKVKIG